MSMKEFNDLKSQIGDYEQRIAELRDKAKRAWMHGRGVEIGTLVEYTNSSGPKRGVVHHVSWKWDLPTLHVAPLKKDGTPGQNITLLWSGAWTVVAPAAAGEE